MSQQQQQQQKHKKKQKQRSRQQPTQRPINTSTNAPYSHNFSYHGMDKIEIINHTVPDIHSIANFTGHRPQNDCDDSQSVNTGVSGTTINSANNPAHRLSNNNPSRFNLPQSTHDIPGFQQQYNTGPPPYKTSNPWFGAANAGNTTFPSATPGPIYNSQGSDYGNFLGHQNQGAPPPGFAPHQQQVNNQYNIPYTSAPNPNPQYTPQQHPQYRPGANGPRPQQYGPNPAMPLYGGRPQQPNHIGARPQPPPYYQENFGRPPPATNQHTYHGNSGYDSDSSSGYTGPSSTTQNGPNSGTGVGTGTSIINGLKSSIKNLDYIDLLPAIITVVAALHHEMKHKNNPNKKKFHTPSWVDGIQNVVALWGLARFAKNRSDSSSHKQSGGKIGSDGENSKNNNSNSGSMNWGNVLNAALNSGNYYNQMGGFGGGGGFGGKRQSSGGNDPVAKILGNVVNGMFKKQGKSGTRDINTQSNENSEEIDLSAAIDEYTAQYYYDAIYNQDMDLQQVPFEMIGGAAALKALQTEQSIKNTLNVFGLNLPPEMSNKDLYVFLAYKEAEELYRRKTNGKNRSLSLEDSDFVSIVRSAIATCVQIKLRGGFENNKQDLEPQNEHQSYHPRHHSVRHTSSTRHGSRSSSAPHPNDYNYNYQRRRSAHTP